MSSQIPPRYIPIDTPTAFVGGMGKVICCKDQNLERIVAIKFINEVENQRRLLDEIAALQKIRSKHVVQIYDIFMSQSDQQIGIVQEYVPGEDLTSFVENNTLSSNDYLKLLYQISSGISDIHFQGLIHRDIKPNNMKFDQSRIIKLFDFGLARFSGQNDSTLGFTGTPGFAAPELYKSGQVSFTNAIDVYAFGIIAWYISGQHFPKQLLRIPPEIEQIPSFSSFGLDLPSAICDILDKTLAENPVNRPTMLEVKNLIGNYLLLGQHRGLLISGNQEYVIEKIKQVAKLDVPNYGSIHIKYDGLNFIIDLVKGAVFINNIPAQKGRSLPKDCVITLGEKDSSRLFITFDISNPEVVL
ncbi:MAG: serine/threonine-protein kinase [Crocosphaera sp.]|nr:serine/threonine-protein kinase [Crocosphaera sp.]